MENLRVALAGKWDMIAVNTKETVDKVDKFLQECGWGGEAVLDENGELARRFAVQVFPTTLLLTVKCEIILFSENEVGSLAFLGQRKWDDPRMVQFFEKTAEMLKSKS